MKNNELIFLSNNDIPFVEAQVTVHQPTIKEISMISEEEFFSGCKVLNFNKFMLEDVDKLDLENQSDFEVFMSIMCSKDKLKYRNSVRLVLALLFPDYQFKFTPTDIVLLGKENTTRINQENYDSFKELLVEMFALKDLEGASEDYNPGDARAARIVKKLEEAKAKKNKLQNASEGQQKIAILSRYVSILSVGLGIDINTLMDYTVFQLKDAFNRFQKKQQFDIHLKAQLAGAKDLEEVDNWMMDIH